MSHTLPQSAHFPPPNSARLWTTTRATQNGASTKTAPPLSMGPTPFSVGYFNSDEITATIHTGFNGANAFQRWIHSVIGSLVSWALSLQWGQRLSALDTGGLHDESRLRRAASMGPTPFSVGYPPISDDGMGIPTTLQWGQRLSALDTGSFVDHNNHDHSGFNGANAFQRWILHPTRSSSTIHPLLQWGQRLSALDTFPADAGESCSQSASMGPTPFSVGYSQEVKE